MKAVDTNSIESKANELERRGQRQEALQFLLDVGAIDLAIQMLVRHKRPSEAARLRLQSIGVPLKAIHQLPYQQQQLVLEAASHLEQGLEWSRAATIYLQLHRPDRIDQLFEKALFTFTTITTKSPHYRDFSHRLIRLAIALDRVSFELDHVLAHFIKTGPQSSQELNYFFELARLYTNNHQTETAERVLRALLQQAPNHQAARALLATTRAEPQHAESHFHQILAQDSTYNPHPTGLQGQPLPMLDDAPRLPGLPPLPQPVQLPPPGSPAPSSKEALFPALTAKLRDRAPAYIPPPTTPPLAPPPLMPAMTAQPSPPPLLTLSLYADEQPDEELGSTTNEEQWDTNTTSTGSDIDPGSQTDISALPVLPASSPILPAMLENAFLYNFSPGTSIDGRYHIVKKIGQGGMATVFCAFDEQLDEKVALKVFDPFFSNEKTFLRFKRELKLSRKLSHPNIIRHHDIGSHQQYHYISMELLQGEDLESMSFRQKIIPFEFGTQLLLQACEGLQAAHELGVIHRDIKPSNFFLTDEGVLKVMDFGIAIETGSSKLTATGSIVGTGIYMAPERATGQRMNSPASDLYSLGVMAFEMFTGRVPFYHDNIIPLLMMHVHNPPPKPQSINPKIPDFLERIIMRLLDKEPNQRYQTCRELAADLNVFLQRCHVQRANARFLGP